eukprot:6378368-Amphidinium_carterae.1
MHRHVHLCVSSLFLTHLEYRALSRDFSNPAEQFWRWFPYRAISVAVAHAAVERASREPSTTTSHVLCFHGRSRALADTIVAQICSLHGIKDVLQSYHIMTAFKIFKVIWPKLPELQWLTTTMNR